MKIRVHTQKLLQALLLLSRISTKHATLAVLQCVFMEAKNNKLTLKSTNLELSLEILVECEVVEEGVIAVPVNTLLQTIQFTSEQFLNLESEDGVLQIEMNKTNTSIKSIAHEEFPTLNKLKGSGLKINKQTFSLGIKTVAFAASVSSIKPELGSVCIQQKKEHTLTFVATDAFRLMEKTVPQTGLVLDQVLLIPQKNAQEIVRIFDALETNPQMVVNDNQCAFVFEESGVYLTTRLVAGSFPDYEQIIPKEYCTTVTVIRADLQNSFKKTAIFLNKYQQVTLTITTGGVTISAQNNEVGHITHTINAEVEGEELTLNFNQQYITDPLSYFEDDSLVLKFAGIGRSLVFKGLSDNTLRYLVMPMNR